MEILGIQGSPRRGWNSEQLLEAALAGAQEAGAEVRSARLYDHRYQGCESCFVCKRKDSRHSGGPCAVQDGLRLLLEESLEANGLILASPIYLGEVTGMMRSYMERLLFPMVSYERDQDRAFDGEIEGAFLFCMGLPQEEAKARHYDEMMAHNLRYLKLLGGQVESLASYDRLQFDDYSQMAASRYDQAQKEKIHQEQFPKDLAAAKALGQRMAERIQRKKGTQ